jgi:hypothetical protein
MDRPEETLQRLLAGGPNRRVLVTGLGRGGTTAIASLLHWAGYNLSGDAPTDLVYFEDERLRAFLLEGQVDQLEAELNARAERYPLVAWKDPKLYGARGAELLQRLPEDWMVIVVFRDPVAIARRRTVTDGVEFRESMPHVLRFMGKLSEFAEAAAKSRRVCYVSYEKLVTEPVSTITEIFRYLGVEPGQDVASYLWGKMRQSQEQYLAGTAVQVTERMAGVNTGS